MHCHAADQLNYAYLDDSALQPKRPGLASICSSDAFQSQLRVSASLMSPRTATGAAATKRPFSEVTTTSPSSRLTSKPSVWSASSAGTTVLPACKAGAVRTANRAAPRAGSRGNGQETAAFTSSTTFFSTTALHFCSAYDTGHRSPSSRLAASWKPRVEYR